MNEATISTTMPFSDYISIGNETSAKQYDPKDDITPLEVAYLLEFFAVIIVNNPSPLRMDHETYKHWDKIQRHFT